MTPARSVRRGELALSAGLTALAAFMFVQTLAISSEGGYSAVGPRFTPTIVAAGLLVAGLLLLREAVTGGWRGMEGVTPHERFHGSAFLWILGGLVVQMAVIGTIGFTLASTILFAFVTRGFGSRRWLRDVAGGFALCLAVFLFFTRVLNLSLPALVPGVL